jgi:Acetyltransferase (GNAT) family
MSRSPQCTVRAADQRDVPTLVQLLEAYMHETFKVAWRGSAEALRRDGFGQEFECQVVVTSDGRVIGFVAWTKSYDLHHCMTGGSILDLYVLPESQRASLPMSFFHEFLDFRHFYTLSVPQLFPSWYASLARDAGTR